MAQSGFGFWKIGVTIVLTILFLAVATAIASAASIYVPDDYPTIQAAVDAVNAGDTIIVRDGTYTENVYVNKDHLTIKSEKGAASTIVQAENQDSPVFGVNADYVNISGFTVEGATGAAGIILNVNDDYCTISNNDIVLNEVGILLQYSSHNTVINNNINSNQYGIWLYKSGGNMITNNNINSNHRGIYMRFSYDNKITENTFKENAEYGLYMLCYKDYDYVVRCNGRNKIYHNNFVDNFLKPQMYASDSLDQNLRNYLDDDYPSGGNYWSDYAGEDLYGGSSQDQPGSDGIGDTPYISHDFYGGYLHDGYCLNPCQDGYPLMNPWTPSEPDTTPPTVTTVSPQNGAPDVAIDTVVTATFSEAMDSSTITTDSFTLAGSAVSGTVTYDSDTNTATFTPDANLEYDHEYTATLSTDITDEAGNPLAEEYSWKFTTESAVTKTIYVDDDFIDDPANHKWNTIQEGVDDANDGDKIIVYPGTYTENVDVGKSVTIESEDGAEVTIVRAADPNDHVFEVRTEHVHIRGFTAKGGNAGIYLLAYAEECNIIDNICSNNLFGIYFDYYSSSNIIKKNNISFNSRYGIFFCHEEYNNLIYLNNFLDNADNVHSPTDASNIWNSSQQITYTYKGGRYTNYLGNYWDDYIGSDANNDGIGDTPYPINSDDDNYPLVERFENYFAGEGPTCKIELQKNGVKIDSIKVGEGFDIVITDYSGDIEKVRFLSDESQNGKVDEGFTWTDWHDWDTSSGDWNAESKIKKWSFATEGVKEVWAEVKDDAGQTAKCSANIITDDLYWLAKAIASEAGSVWDVDHWVRCSDEERIAVGWTVLNRLDSGTFGDSIKNIVNSSQYAHNQEPTQEIITLSEDLLKREISDPTGGATYFFSPIGMPKEGEENKCKPPIGNGNMDCGGGLYQVPGTSEKVYFPSWAKPKEGWTVTDFYQTVEDLEWVSGLANVRNWYFMFYRPANQPPTCAIELRKDEVEIDEIDVGEFFDIYVGDSTDDTGIREVRLSSDESQDGISTGEWTKWYQWDTSSEDWDADTKIQRWAFDTGGEKEVWAEVEDDAGNVAQCHANIFVHPAENQRPDPPTDLIQLLPDGTKISVGGAVDERTVVFKGVVTDPDGDRVKLQIELRRLDEYGGEFDETQDGLKESDFVASSSEAEVSFHDLIPGDYHWRARTIDVYEEVSEWADFGNNPLSDPDFIVVSEGDDNPRIVCIEPESGAPGIEARIKGKNFKAYIFEWLNFGGEQISAESWSDNEIVVKVPSGKGVVDVRVVPDMKESNPVKFTYNDPFIDRIDPSSGRPDEEVTIIGKDFGYKELHPTFWVKFGKSHSPKTSPWTDTEIVAKAPSDYGTGIKDKMMMIQLIKYASYGVGGPLGGIVGDIAEDILFDLLAHGVRIPVAEGRIEVDVRVRTPTEKESNAEVFTYEVDEIILSNLLSPGELRIYDSQGRVTGLVNGQVKEEISHSYCANNIILIVYPSDSYRYEVVGTEEGTYGLGVYSVKNGNDINFTATDIPTALGAIHQYTIDWEALSQGEQGVTVQIDNDGDGVFEQTFTIGNTFQLPIASFTYSPANPVINETITFNASNSYENITKYEWNFGDGNISDTTEPIITHTYTSAGDYTVNLTVTDDDGATGSTSQLINVSVATLSVLKIEKTSSPNPVPPGGTLTYTIEYCIEGGPATNVLIVENYPKAVTFISADPTPDAGTNNKWTLGTLPAGASGQIIIKLKVPESRDLSFTETGSVTGEGFVMVSKDLSTEQKPYSLKNVVTLSCAELAPVSASAITTVSGVPGTSLEITEHGSGIYSSDEILNLGTKNKSIMLQKSTEAEYLPTSFNFSDGFAVNFATRWMQDICARNIIMGDAMHKKIKDASYIKDETIAEVGKYRTSMDFESSFYGAAHIGTVSKSAKTSEDYIGAFEITWAGREECRYLFNWSRVPGNATETDNEKVIRFLVDVLDLGWAENATITKSADEMSINITDDGNTATITIAENKKTATVKVGGEIIYVLEVRIEDDTLNIYDCKLEKMEESVSGIGYVMLDKDLASGQMQVREHGSGLYSSDMNFESGRLDKVTEAEYQPTTFNFSDGFDVNFSSKWFQSICTKNLGKRTAIHKKISDAYSMEDDTTATKSSMEFESSFNGSMHIGARTKGTRISEDYIGVFNITELIKIGKPAISTPSTPTPDWLPCPFPKPGVSTPPSGLPCPSSDP